MFFETTSGDLIPISRIQRIRAIKARGSEPKWTVELSGDEEVEIGHSTKISLEFASEASFAATPGTKVLRVDAGRMFEYEVIGWSVPLRGNPLPITMDGMNDGSDADEYLPVLLPDGRVYKSEDETYSLQEFKRLNDIYDDVITLEIPCLEEALAAG